MMQEFPYNVSGTASILYPTATFFGLLVITDDVILEIQKEHPFKKGWGEPQSMHLYEREAYPMPRSLDMVFLSVIEEKYYSIVAPLPYERLEQLWQETPSNNNKSLYTSIVVGMAPYGGIAVWAYGIEKATVVAWMQCEEVQVKMSDFMPFQSNTDLSEVCNNLINSDPRVKENLERNGLPPRDLFDNYMKQFTYRYQVEFEKWDEEKGEWKQYENDEEKKQMPEFDYIEEALYDGTHDKLHDGGLMSYHEAGKPKKLAVQWHLKKSEWTAYFWFEDQSIREIFDRFYGAHRDTKTDFILHFDPNSNKYELALYRYGLREPQVIPESAYQLIVFKNKFESFRSDNYAQERGAWIW